MRPDWMTEEAYNILEFLVESGLTLPPQGIAFNVEDVSYHQTTNAIRRLKQHGLIEQPDEAPVGLDPGGVYRATDLGEQFVTGDITLKELRERME